MKIKNKNKNLTILYIVVILSVLSALFSNFFSETAPTYISDGNLYIHFLDVGQGDSTLIMLPNKEVMLIDCGTNKSGNSVVDYIKSLDIRRIDYLIGTHPHEDHIGGMDDVINSFEIGQVYMPRVTTDTKTFEDVLDAIANKGLLVNTAKSGVSILNEGDITAKFLAPVSDTYNNLNNYSAVVMLNYNGGSFLFTGDAEKESELEILKQRSISAHVLKVGHHGSTTSTADDFLNGVNPLYAVISCGSGNTYGHPHKEILDKLEDNNVTVLRTDKLGTIILEYDGNTFTFMN